MKHKIFFCALLTLSFLLLLCFPSLSLEGARKGLLLWYQTVLPTLLPFMICMNLMVSLGAVHFLTAPFYPLLHGLFGLSRAGSFVLLGGMLCGYPMGAKNCSDFLDNNAISLAEARCLYAVSSFPSPMFLAGYMMHMANTGLTPLPLPLWKMAAAVYLPAILLFFLSSRFYHLPESLLEAAKTPGISSPARTLSPNEARLSSLPAPTPSPDKARLSSLPAPTPSPDEACFSSSPAPALSLDEALLSSIEVMVKIGGYIMLFSILAVFICHLPLPGTLLPALMVCIAEMTTGIEYASQNLSGLAKALLIGFGGAFGGLSGAFQVHSVTKNAGLSIRHYLLWKTAHGLLTAAALTLLAARH